MKFIHRFFLLSLISLATLSKANADDITSGPTVSGLTTFRDTSTGYYWLKLDNFFGQSTNQMLSTANAAGFTLANTSQLTALLDRLPLTGGSVALWDGYASIIGRAPNRPLIWGSYNSGTARYGWAYSYQGDTAWSFDTNMVAGTDVPNTGTGFEDMNLWAYIISLGPDAANTLAAVQQNASELSGVYNVQAAALQAGLTYDCNTFDQYGLCASVGGRATYGLTEPSGNQQAGLVIVSHKPDPHFRYGGFADQSVATASPNGIKYNNSGPMFGFFGYWNHQKDNMGWGASVTTAFSNSNLTVTRNASLANTEAGSGNTEMQGQAVQAQATYAMQATTRIKAQPYLGLRYYRVATGGYSEGSNADVTSPLTYNAMAQEVFAAVGGLGTSVFLAEKLTGNASVGIQQNLNYKMGNYQGTSSISGLESFSVSMPSNINSMATATAGVTYAIKKNEKLSLNALWQQQAFSATNTITALATYSIGF